MHFFIKGNGARIHLMKRYCGFTKEAVMTGLMKGK